MRRLLIVFLTAVSALLAMTSWAAACDLPGVQPTYGAAPVVRAGAIYFGSGGDLFVRDLDWRRLTTSSGTATGTVYANDCKPDCAQGKVAPQPATLRFWNVKPASTPYFQCVRITYRDPAVKGLQFPISDQNASCATV